MILKYFWKIRYHIYRHHVETKVELNVLEAGHSKYRRNMLMLSGGQTQQLMCCWEVVVAIIGTLMVTGNYRTLLNEKPPNDDLVLEVVNQHSSNIQARLIIARRQLHKTKRSIGLLKSRSSTMLAG